MTQNILIAGAGLGGLTAALALVRSGHRVQVFEQAAAVGEVGTERVGDPGAAGVPEAAGVAVADVAGAGVPEAADAGLPTLWLRLWLPSALFTTTNTCWLLEAGCCALSTVIRLSVAEISSVGGSSSAPWSENGMLLR